MRTLTVILSVLFLFGCGTIRMAQQSGVSIASNSSIDVSCPENDPVDVQRQIERFLLRKGVRLISTQPTPELLRKDEIFVTHALGHSIEENTISKTDAAAVYTITIDYNAYRGSFHWLFNDFSGSMVDNRTGTVILSSSFSGDRSAKSVMKAFINKLDNLIE